MPGARSMAIDTGLTARLRRQLGRGQLILFTGAGFSCGAFARSGRPIPTAEELKRELWRLAFPSKSVVDERSELGDVFELAVARAGNASRELLSDLLKVDVERSPDRFRAWFSLPWYRHYTLNIDDLDEAVAGRYVLPRPLYAISGPTDPLLSHEGLLSVHLNGRLRDYPNVTFSIRQYGQRASQPDAWYQTLVADLLTYPVLFIGTVLDEPGLWQYIELRRQRAASQVEMRPASYLVAPSLPDARAALLKRFNIDWIEATEEQIFAEVFKDATDETRSGHSALKRRYQEESISSVLEPLAQVRECEPLEDLSLFLLGRTPVWADIQDGFAVERSFERPLLTNVLTGNHDVVVLTGTAASGKSTTAMRLAIGLEAEGKGVYVLDAPESSGNVGSIVEAIRQVRPDVLLIDDVDSFGSGTGRLLRALTELPTPPLVLAAIRSSRLQSLDLTEELDGLNVLEMTVPHLHDSDIDALIDALSRANRLGRLMGQSQNQRRRIFREQAGRQLLVAMYYATSGEKLQDRVFSECEDLAGSSRLAYGMVALATMERQWMSREEILLGIGAVGPGVPGNRELSQLRGLIERNLILDQDKKLRLRHRWIAETTIDFYINNGLIGNVLKAFAFVMAVKADPQMNWHARERRLLRRVINHDYLIRLVSDAGSIREVYSFVEDQLSWDYHYWLQRGSFEVETGDLPTAENFLNSARGLTPRRDSIVETEYAYMTLKKAAKHPRAPGAALRAEEALRDLEDIMRQRGEGDFYPYHVYGSQGLSWARRAPITPDERKGLLRRLLAALEQGVERHPQSADLRRLMLDLKREGMMNAVDREREKEEDGPSLLQDAPRSIGTTQRQATLDGPIP